MDAAQELARIAAYIGDSSRASMLMGLAGGQSRPASELAVIAGISPQAASNHLKMLLEGGLLDVTRVGRNKYYRLKGPSVATALESLLGLVHPIPNFRGSAPPELAFARTCYDHLAGELSVGILNRLLERKFLRATEAEFRLTQQGSRFFTELGIDVDATTKRRRKFAYPCLDWSHRVPHLGGALGAGLLEWLLRSRSIVRSERHRGVRVTDKGEQTLARVFAIQLTRGRCSIAGQPASAARLKPTYLAHL
ncbi:MAG TPA: helix-turn-helix domain-containing protein [Blastocatellia bacterium]